MKNTFLILLLAVLANMMNVATAQNQKKKNILVVGGGSSHDFNRWYKNEDTKTINSINGVHAIYTENTDSIRFYLKTMDLLVLTNNQPIPASSQQAIEKFVESGKPLVLLHAAVWYNWQDWPQYNLKYVGGGSKSHENFQAFKNIVVNNAHPITAGVSESFTFKDELYRHVPDPKGLGVNVLAIGQSLETSKVYPVVYTVNHKTARIVGITLGHDEHSHLDKDYKKILTNSIQWTLKL